MASLYANAAVIGWSIADVKAASMWEYHVAVEGYAAAHDPDADKALTEDEADALWEWIGA